ncbi:MAG: hypothetical protein R8K46_01600 [Mariprofundaceae bacterium]
MLKRNVIGGLAILALCFIGLLSSCSETEEQQRPSLRQTDATNTDSPLAKPPPDSKSSPKTLPNKPFRGGRPDLGKTR